MELLNLVDAGDIAMAAIIRPPFSLHSDLRWSTLAHEPFRLLVPRHEDGNDWAELLSSEPFVRYDRASFGGRQVDRFLRAAHLSVQQVCELDELDAIVRLVANGVGLRRCRRPPLIAAGPRRCAQSGLTHSIVTSALSTERAEASASRHGCSRSSFATHTVAAGRPGRSMNAGDGAASVAQTKGAVIAPLRGRSDREVSGSLTTLTHGSTIEVNS